MHVEEIQTNSRLYTAACPAGAFTSGVNAVGSEMIEGPQNKVSQFPQPHFDS